MIYAKTALGLQAFQHRDNGLSPKSRSVLIMIDGKKDVSALIPMLGAIGAGMNEVDQLLQAGYITATGLSSNPPDAAIPINSQLAPARSTPEQAPPSATPINLFTQAYQTACQLTSELGLRGFRLNLSVEGATKMEDLIQLAPKIRDAVGDKKFLPLARILGIRL